MTSILDQFENDWKQAIEDETVLLKKQLIQLKKQRKPRVSKQIG